MRAVDIAPAARRGRVRSEVLSPSAKSGLCDERGALRPRERRAHLRRPRGRARRRPATRLRGQRRLDRAAHHRLAVDVGQQLVRPAHAASSGRRPAPARRCAAPRRARRRRVGSPARGCGRRRDLRQQAAGAHAHDVARGRPAGRRPARCSTQSKPLSLGERAQPGRPSTGVVAEPAEQQQVAGIDRHAEMIDRAAGALDRRRDHVAPVGDRRGAGDQQHLGSRRPARSAIAAGQRASVMRAARPRRPARSRAPPGAPFMISTRLVEHAFLDAGQPGLDQADAARRGTAATRSSGPPSRGDGDAALERRARRRRRE